LASLLCLTFVSASLYLSENVFSWLPWVRLYHQNRPLFDQWNHALYAMDALILALIGSPLIYGLLTVIHAAADGRSLPFSELFAAFSGGRRYCRAVTCMLALLLPRAALVLLCRDTARLALAQSDGRMRILCLIGIALAALLLIWLMGLGDALLMLTMRHENIGIFRLVAMSARSTWRHLGKLLCFKLSFLPWALLSLASLGVLLFIHALPYFMLSHLFFTEKITQ
jgi:hypothetical protein